MKKKLKGGIETIIAAVIFVGIVIALVIAVILPTTEEIAGTGSAAKDKVTDLKERIQGSSSVG